MFSLTPGMPGRSEQMPRQTMSIFTPAWLARYSACTTAGSSRPLILAMIRAGLPAFWFAASRSIFSIMNVCSRLGATTSFRHCGSSP